MAITQRLRYVNYAIVGAVCRHALTTPMIIYAPNFLLTYPLKIKFMTPIFSKRDAELSDELLYEIRALSFRAFCYLVRLLLYRSGYTGVHLIEPISGGRAIYDGLAATSRTDLATALTLIRVKQAEGAPVSRRFVDQLRGAMARLGAEHGLLIVTGHFSHYALEAVKQHTLPPVRLMNGHELVALMKAHGLGVKDRHHVDTTFFTALEKRAF